MANWKASFNNSDYVDAEFEIIPASESIVSELIDHPFSHVRRASSIHSE